MRMAPARMDTDDRDYDGFYFKVKREEIARYGLMIQDVGRVIESAIGGSNISMTIEGVGDKRKKIKGDTLGILGHPG